MITINTVLILILVHERYEWWYTSSNVLRTLLVFGIDSGLLQLQLQRLHSELSITELTCLCSKWLLSANPRCCKTSSPKRSQSSRKAGLANGSFASSSLLGFPQKEKCHCSMLWTGNWWLLTSQEVLQSWGSLCRVFWSGSMQHQLVIETPNNPSRTASVLHLVDQWLVFCSMKEKARSQDSSLLQSLAVHQDWTDVAKHPPGVTTICVLRVYPVHRVDANVGPTNTRRNTGQWKEHK